MSYEVFPDFMRLAIVVFWVLLPAVLWATLRDLKRRGETESVLVSRSVRDHVIGACLRGVSMGLVFTVPVMVVWGGMSWPSLGWRVLFGWEIFLAFVILAAGLASVSGRLALGLMNKKTGGRVVPGLLIRWGGVLGAGGLYGLALWWFSPGGSAETLFAVFALGATTTFLGLNRLGEISHQNLEHLSQYLGRRS